MLVRKIYWMILLFLEIMDKNHTIQSLGSLEREELFFSIRIQQMDRTWITQGIAGYVYKDYQSNTFNFVYEISNGESFAYTTESKETYGEKDTWEKTGNEFYSKKISL